MLKIISRSMPTRLHARIGVIVGVLIVLSSLVLAYSLARAAQQKVQQQAELNLQAMADQVGRELSAGLDGFARDIATQSDRDVFTNPDSTPEQMRAALNTFKSLNPEFAFVSIIDAQSALVLAANDGIYEGGNLRDRPVYQQGIKGLYLGDVHPAVRLAVLLPKPTNGEPRRFLDVATPVRDASGRIIRVFAVHIGFEWSKQVVDSVLAPIKSSQHTEILLVDTDGKVVLSDGKSIPVGTDLVPVVGREAGLSSQIKWPDGQVYLTSVAPTLPRGSFPGFGWRVVAREPYSNVLATVKDMKFGFYAAALALGLAVAILAWLVAARIVRPLGLLAAEADHAVAGAGQDFAPNSDAGEVTSVRRALSHLASSARQHARASVLSAQQFTALAQSLPEVVWQADRVGCLQYVSKLWAAGAPGQDEATVADFRVVVHQDDREKFDQAWQRALSTGDQLDVKVRLETPEYATWRWSEIKARLVGDGEDRLWIGTLIDIHHITTLAEGTARALNEERAARTAAERVARARDEFLAIASHELRSPLSAISGWADILVRQNSSDPTVAKAAEVIRRNAHVQTTLVNDLIDMSAVLSGKLVPHLEPTEVATVLKEVVSSHLPAARRKDIALTVSLQEAVYVNGDARRLAQVFSNVIANAIKFTPTGGFIEVISAVESNQAAIEVRDSGRGIDAEFLPFVFERMRQEDSSATRHAGGLGLGLAIAKSIAELHGGSIAVASAGRDRGTSFVIRVPLLHQSAARMEDLSGSRSDEIDTFSFPGLRMLVVDDEPDAREVAEATLMCLGVQVTTVASGIEALALLNCAEFDLMMTDIGMPEMDGLELIRQVRAGGAGSNSDVPIVALTAFAMQSDRDNVFAAGAQAYVAKPISLHGLSEGLTAALQQHRTAS